jgi:hypothetical protein
MTRKGVDLATISFPTRHLAKKFFGEMLNRYRPGDLVNAEDARHLAALLARHTEHDEKVGCGVDHFEVVWADYGTQCFHVVRLDGTARNFSYHHCIRSAALDIINQSNANDQQQGEAE